MQEASGLSTTPNTARTISCKAWNSPAEYPSWVARCDTKGSVSTVLNPIFSKKVQGQKHPWRWGIFHHKIPSIKVLFKTNTKGHTHPSIRLLSKSKTQLVNQRKQKVAFNPGTAHSPETQSYWTWWGAASPILNGTLVVYIYIYIYTSYNRTHIRNAYIYKHRASGREPRSSGGNTSSNPQVSALVPRPVVNEMDNKWTNAIFCIMGVHWSIKDGHQKHFRHNWCILNTLNAYFTIGAPR